MASFSKFSSKLRGNRRVRPARNICLTDSSCIIFRIDSTLSSVASTTILASSRLHPTFNCDLDGGVVTTPNRWMDTGPKRAPISSDSPSRFLFLASNTRFRLFHTACRSFRASRIFSGNVGTMDSSMYSLSGMHGNGVDVLNPLLQSGHVFLFFDTPNQLAMQSPQYVCPHVNENGFQNTS